MSRLGSLGDAACWRLRGILPSMPRFCSCLSAHCGSGNLAAQLAKCALQVVGWHNEDAALGVEYDAESERISIDASM